MCLKVDLDINNKGEYVLTAPYKKQPFHKLIYKGKNREILEAILFTMFMNYVRENKKHFMQAGKRIEYLLRSIDNIKENN